MSQNIFVIVEQSDDGFRKVTFEALSIGREIADKIESSLTAVVLGSGVNNMATVLGEYGADRILIADDPVLAEYLTDAYANLLADIINKENPAVLILGASTQGKDLAARLAARLNAPLAMDCVAIRVENGQILATRPMYGGKILADIALNGVPQMIAVRPNAMAIKKSQGTGSVETIDVAPGKTDLRFIKKILDAEGKVELSEADVVVAGGRGMNGSDFSKIEALAQTLGGAVGASRTVVDEGWRPHSDQVGQTGKVVSPNLYIACGISGAIQHLAGMLFSKVIVAINKDPEAPIFLKSDYGIVGDLFDILPCITEEVKKLK